MFSVLFLKMCFSDNVVLSVVSLKGYMELTEVTTKSLLVSSACLASFLIKLVIMKL